MAGRMHISSSDTRTEALEFSDRELRRHTTFEKIWNGRLHTAFADIAPYYERASNVASLGLCNSWRRRFVTSIDIGPGQRVLDVCAGTNAVGVALSRRQEGVRVCAIEKNRAMQEVGKRAAQGLGFQIESIIGDANRLPFQDNYFDVVTLEWASRHLRLMDAFSEIRRVLKPNGCFCHCDMLKPKSKFVMASYGAYLNVCISLTALLFRSGSATWGCRNYFVRAIQEFYTSEELSELLSQVGFVNISQRVAPGGIIAIHKAFKA
jgi:demethylmenaquinone methyltransferase/2-methoxy-6-polyprenyl-1,4-benzoquinol methylase